MSCASVVVDALLGTGLEGGARGAALEMIRRMNRSFPLAKWWPWIFPSGLTSDAKPQGEFVRVDCTVTFTALKGAHAMLRPAT